MKPSSWDQQMGLASPRESAASQSDQTNNPSKNEVRNEVGLDVSHHTLGRKEVSSIRTSLGLKMTPTTARQWFPIARNGPHHICRSSCSPTSPRPALSGMPPRR